MALPEFDITGNEHALIVSLPDAVKVLSVEDISFVPDSHSLTDPGDGVGWLLVRASRSTTYPRNKE